MPHCPRSLTVTGALMLALMVPTVAPASASAATLPTGLGAHRVAAPHLSSHLASAAGTESAAPRTPVAAPTTANRLTRRALLTRLRRTGALRSGVAGSSTTVHRLPAPTPTSTPTAAPAPLSANPFAGKRFTVTAGNEYARAADAVRSSDPAKAHGLDVMAGQSTGFWWGDWNSVSTLKADVARKVAADTADGSVPVYVLYDIMHRDGGTGYSAGGAASLADYKAWIDQFVAGVGAHQPLVVVEPDAVNDLYSMTGTLRAERDAALSYALTSLKAAGIPAYLDAGGPSIHAPSIAAQLLTEAGVADAQGFSVNVSNFQTTADDTAWGTAVSALVGGKHFVIDTGRNGNGSVDPGTDAQYWCNPPGRALGHLPTTATGNALVDAYAWIKAPGESDGTCRGYAPAGTFSADYAYGLYSRSV